MERLMNYKMIIVLVLSGLVALFIMQNVAVVEIKYVFLVNSNVKIAANIHCACDRVCHRLVYARTSAT